MTRLLPAALMNWADNFYRQIFRGSPVAFLLFSVPLIVWTVEIVMNLRNGEGWVSALHLGIVGPLWLAIIILMVYAACREMTRIFGAQDSDE